MCFHLRRDINLIGPLNRSQIGNEDTPCFHFPQTKENNNVKSPCRKTAAIIFYDPLSITVHTVIKYTSSTEMSTNFKSVSISITADFVRPTVPDYEEISQTIIFTTADKFEE